MDRRIVGGILGVLLLFGLVFAPTLFGGSILIIAGVMIVFYPAVFLVLALRMALSHGDRALFGRLMLVVTFLAITGWVFVEVLMQAGASGLITGLIALVSSIGWVICMLRIAHLSVERSMPEAMIAAYMVLDAVLLMIIFALL